MNVPADRTAIRQAVINLLRQGKQSKNELIHAVSRMTQISYNIVARELGIMVSDKIIHREATGKIGHRAWYSLAEHYKQESEVIGYLEVYIDQIDSRLNLFKRSYYDLGEVERAKVISRLIAMCAFIRYQIMVVRENIYPDHRILEKESEANDAFKRVNKFVKENAGKDESVLTLLDSEFSGAVDFAATEIDKILTPKKSGKAKP